MALSNAVVPVLPQIAESTTLQGAVYSAYFLGALFLVLPAGLLCDRIGEVPLIRAGLFLTVISGLLMLVVQGSPYLLIFARVIEGTGAGLFVSSALSWVNAQPGHLRMTGIFMALLNGGLVTGLIASGAVDSLSGISSSGIILFTLITMVPLGASLLPGFSVKSGVQSPGERGGPGSSCPLPGDLPCQPVFHALSDVLRRYFWLWLSALILIGCTGVVSALYPELSDVPPHVAGLQIAAMSVSTAITVLLVSRVRLPPVPTIRVCAVLMAVSILLTFRSPWGFIATGVVAGVIMIAQLAYLSQAGHQQGLLIGLFNTASYGGMTILPFVAGVVAEFVLFPEPFLTAFLLTAGLALVVAATIGQCACEAGPGRAG